MRRKNTGMPTTRQAQSRLGNTGISGELGDHQRQHHPPPARGRWGISLVVNCWQRPVPAAASVFAAAALIAAGPA